MPLPNWTRRLLLASAGTSSTGFKVALDERSPHHIDSWTDYITLSWTTHMSSCLVQGNAKEVQNAGGTQWRHEPYTCGGSVTYSKSKLSLFVCLMMGVGGLESHPQFHCKQWETTIQAAVLRSFAITYSSHSAKFSSFSTVQHYSQLGTARSAQPLWDRSRVHKASPKATVHFCTP